MADRRLRLSHNLSRCLSQEAENSKQQHKRPERARRVMCDLLHRPPLISLMASQPAELTTEPHQTGRYAKNQSIEDVLLKVNILLLNYFY